MMKSVMALALGFGLLLSPATVQELSAGPACRKEGRANCIKRPACRWVPAHKRKNGTKVAAHCRAKGTRKK